MNEQLDPKETTKLKALSGQVTFAEVWEVIKGATP
jgi:hypothetical protein